MTDKDRDEEEIERRRDEALRRALSTPPKQHKDEGEKNKKTERKHGDT